MTDRPSPAEFVRLLQDEARRLQFSAMGVCPAAAPPGLSRFHDWLTAGFAGEMDYLTERRQAYSHPHYVLAGAKSLLLLAFPYAGCPTPAVPAGSGRIARYAFGQADYHDLIHDRLHQLVAFVGGVWPGSKARGVVDSAPLLEREFAQLSGLGWIGKNTLLLSPTGGSYFFLAALLLDAELPADAPFAADHCGTCTACLDACPTQAFPAPHVLDATRCISYLTIEHRGPIPAELRPLLGDWLFGCDVCQEVCPWNRFSEPPADPQLEPAPGHNPLDLAALFLLDDAGFRRQFRQTPLWRSRRRGILRNAALVLGNQGDLSAVPSLLLGLADSEPLVRGASAWALGRLGGVEAREALCARRAVEEDDAVRDEIDQALREL